MTPETAFIIQWALKFGIDSAIKLIALMKVQNPTTEQWMEVFEPAKKSYDDYIAAEVAKRVAAATGFTVPVPQPPVP